MRLFPPAFLKNQSHSPWKNTVLPHPPAGRPAVPESGSIPTPRPIRSRSGFVPHPLGSMTGKRSDSASPVRTRRSNACFHRPDAPRCTVQFPTHSVFGWTEGSLPMRQAPAEAEHGATHPIPKSNRVRQKNEQFSAWVYILAANIKEKDLTCINGKVFFKINN